MDRIEKHITLRALTSGSYNGINVTPNSVFVSKDLKRILVFHTNDVDLKDIVRDDLYVTCDTTQARQMWQICRKTRTHVNVFSIDLDDVPFDYLHWRNGDSYECNHGGRGYIYIKDKLKYEGYVLKSELDVFVGSLGYTRLSFLDMEKVADYLLFGNEAVDYSLQNLDRYNLDMFYALFLSHQLQLYFKRDWILSCDGYSWQQYNGDAKFNW